MSALGDVAACIEIVRFIKSSIEFVSDINGDASEIEATFGFFRSTINDIATIFEHIKSVIENQGLSESDSFVIIVRDYAKHCTALLESLEDTLPKLPSNPSTRQKVWVALKRKIKEKAIQDQLRFLQQYIQLTQVALWGIEFGRMSTQDDKINQIHKMLSKLDGLPPYSPINEDYRDSDRLRTNIDKIREITESSVYNMKLPAGRGEEITLDLENLPRAFRDLILEEQPPTAPPRNDPVKTLERRRMFRRAANVGSQGAMTREQEMVQEEIRANLLLKCATIRPHQDALGILNRLWEWESQQNADCISPERLGRLGSKVAKLSLDSQRLGHFTAEEQADDCKRASSVLGRSFEVLKSNMQTLQPYPYETMLEVGEIFIHILKETGKATWADQIGNSLRRMIGDLYTIPPDWPHKFEASRSNALAWCEPTSLRRLHGRWPETATVAERPDLLSLEFEVRSADFRFDAAVNGISPIHLAVIYEEKGILAEMLGDVEDINVMNTGPSTPLMEAAMKGNEEIVNLLLTHEASVNRVDAQQRTALHWAQIGNENQAVGIAQSILAAPQGGSILNQEDADGMTALYLACKKGNADMVGLLVVKHQARVNVADVYRITALHATVEANDRLEERLRIAQILLEAKADPNKADNTDRSPLYIACSRGHYDLVRLLLQYGARQNQKGPDGQTPLIVATRHRHADIVFALMRKGAQPNRRDASDRSALDYAARTKTTSEIYNLLRGGAPSSRRQNSLASMQSATTRRTDTTSTRSIAHQSFDLASKRSSSSSRGSSRK